MHTRFYTLAIVLLLTGVLTTACTSGVPETAPVTLAGGAQPEQEQTPTESSLPSGDPNRPVTNEGTPEDVVVPDTQDTTVSPVPEGGEMVPGSAPEATMIPGTASEEETPVTWQSYRNEEFQFKLQYPSVYTLVDPLDTADWDPAPLAQVLFQDQNLAQGETAAFEVPQFAVRVFDNSSQTPLRDWLERNNLVNREGGQEIEPFTVGGVEGLRVCEMTLIAPNCFIYVSHAMYVYQLTPLGEYSDPMIASFKFTQE